MKLDAGRVAAFLTDPGICRLALLYGEDAGLVRERGAALVRQVAGSLDDPFRVVELEREGLPRLVEEMGARSMTGGRRVVRVRDVSDSALAPVQAALKSLGEAFVVLEAGELPPRSKLRAWVEGTPDAVSIACYSEQGAELGRTIAAVLSAAEVRVEPDASAYLTDHLGNDRAATRQELEKLALFVGPRGVVTLSVAIEVVGDLAGLQIDDALYAAMEGQITIADRALELALGEGASPVTVLRTLLGQVQRLERVQIGMQTGQSASESVRSLRPPVFFRRQPALIRAAGLWPHGALAAACNTVWQAERACKQTGTPAVTLCRHVVLTLARRAAGWRR